MSRPKLFAVAVGCVLAAVCGILLLGASVESVRHFGGQRNVSAGEALTLNLWVDPRVRKQSFMRLGLYRDDLPYTLRITAYFKSNEAERMILREVFVRYGDGTNRKVVSPEGQWVAQLEPYEYANSTSEGVKYYEAYKVSVPIAEVIDRHITFDIDIAGELLYEDGKAVPIKVTERFHAERDRRIKFGSKEW
jgi:hypothetical protein